MQSIVTLNVGGCFFQTSKSTMEIHDNYFRAILSNNKEENDDFYFIDRDPSFFRYILNWLRGCKVLPEDALVLQELYSEADFYCMEDMKKNIEDRLKTSSTIQNELSILRSDLRYS